MNKTDIFRQHNWSFFNQTGRFTSVINSSSAQIIPNFCGQILG